MKVIDGHCDVLYKMYLNPDIDFYDAQTSPMDVTYSRMLHSNVKLQCFAIYLPERITQPHFDHYLEYINIFYRRIVRSGLMQAVKTRGDLETVMNGRIPGALLTLEGADALYGNSLYTHTLYQLGVRMIGVTWNYANWAADGVLEPRQGGFTRKGKSFIKDCNELGILLDVSHLSAAAFWDLAAASAKPFVATHSNVKRLCGHPRNLDDEQIRALIRVDGRIGVTFVPWFVESGGRASVDDLITHMDYICALGGERQLVLGSDFDGIDRHIPGLEHAGQYDRLAEALYKKFTNEQVNGFLYRNWHTFLSHHLPVH